VRFRHHHEETLLIRGGKFTAKGDAVFAMILEIGEDILKVILLKVVSSMQQKGERAHSLILRANERSSVHGLEVGGDEGERGGDGGRVGGGRRRGNGLRLEIAITISYRHKLTSNKPLLHRFIQRAQGLREGVRGKERGSALARVSVLTTRRAAGGARA